jgi:hypothetical protein
VLATSSFLRPHARRKISAFSGLASSAACILAAVGELAPMEYGMPFSGPTTEGITFGK